MKAVEGFTGTEPAERAKLEMARDEQVRALQNEEKRYQIAKDLSDNLTVSYNTSEVVMARLLQTTNAKERVYAQAVSFFSTNEVVLTALSASFTGMFGLHEGTQTIEAMKEGVSQSLEVLAEIGGKVQEAAVKAGYGPTIRADAIKKLVDSVVTWQERSHEIIEEMRKQSTANANEIRDAVEDGKRRLARLAEQGKGLTLEAAALQPQATAGAMSAAAPETASAAGGARRAPWRSGAGPGQAPAGRRHARHGRGGHPAPARPPGEAGAGPHRAGGGPQGAPAQDLRGPGDRGPGPRHRAGGGGAQGRALRLQAPAGGARHPPGAALCQPRPVGQVGPRRPGGAHPRLGGVLVHLHPAGCLPAPGPDPGPLAGDRPGGGRCRRPRRGGCRPGRGEGGPGATRIPRRPGWPCGAWRTCAGSWTRSTACASSTGPGSAPGSSVSPTSTARASNYYIVVEGLDGAGNPVKVPIKNEETGKTEVVTKWGLRVDEKVYNAVGRDKKDDGIIEKDRFGTKRRGRLTPDYEMPTTGGAITRW